MPDQRCDIAIIGAGILGLASARELLTRRPGLSITILEKEAEIAQHQTGHNSGVIHSGIYYAPGSLKAKACVTGREKLIRFCDEHGIRYELCGKLIVALDQEELPRLQMLYERGTANGVPGLQMVGPELIREIEPWSAGIRALYAPGTGIVDYSEVARTYAQEATERGATILTNHEVVGIADRGGRYTLLTLGGDVEARYIISCAGLYADRVAKLTDAPDLPRIVPFRGDYYILRPELNSKIKGMIYPVPDPRFPFLGVHFTRRIDGSVWLGPNAVLAFAREGYHRSDLNARDLLEALRFSGFQKMAIKFWRTGVEEMYRDYLKAGFFRALQRYCPELQMSDILPGPSGVRAQALDADGSLVDDFVVNHQGRTLHVRNAPSPAATSSLAIADMIADTAEQSFDLDTISAAGAPDQPSD